MENHIHVNVTCRISDLSYKHNSVNEYRWCSGVSLFNGDNVAGIFVINELPPNLRYVST